MASKYYGKNCNEIPVEIPASIIRNVLWYLNEFIASRLRHRAQMYSYVLESELHGIFIMVPRNRRRTFLVANIGLARFIVLVTRTYRNALHVPLDLSRCGLACWRSRVKIERGTSCWSAGKFLEPEFYCCKRDVFLRLINYDIHEILVD